MKIVTWNCGGALRKKVEILQTLKADIYIVQECERPDESQGNSAYGEFCANSLWVGDLHYKGLGIFATPDISLTRHDWPDHGLKYFLPARINDTFELLGMWAHRANSPTFGYIGQLWKYLQFHIDKMENVILAGDLNSNVRWDKWDRWWNHSDVVRELDEADIVSLYHLVRKINQGNEPEPTFFLQRNHEKAYHIDFMFASRKIAERVKTFDIGEKEFWLQHSDHLPLCTEII
jgi:exonuclease III